MQLIITHNTLFQEQLSEAVPSLEDVGLASESIYIDISFLSSGVESRRYYQ